MRSTRTATERKALCGAVLGAALLAATAPALAQTSVARVEFSVGQVSARDAAGVARPLLKGSRLYTGDTVLTAMGRAQIRFSDGGYTSLQPDTEFRIDEYDFDGSESESSRGFFSLLKGGLRTITGVIGRLNKKAYKLVTPVATIGIRGTEYLAVLGGSLTVHVGDGEIEVCNAEGCRAFGPHQTGYVPDDLSMPVRADEPPTLTPPQERQVYALNAQYQAMPDAGAEYSRNEDVDSDGVTDVLGGPLASGTFYALAVSWGASASLSDHFAVGLLSPAGELVDAKFDGAGGLVEYYAENYGSLPIEGQLDVNGNGVADANEAVIVESASTAGVIGWGRWTMGDALVGQSGGGFTSVRLNGSSSHHYVVGIPTPEMPSGSASYSLLGATSPTLSSGAGAPGSVSSASLNANFDLATVSLDMNLAVGGNGYAVSVPNMQIGSGSAPLVAPNDFTFFGAGNAANGSNCISACPTAVEGYFAGSGAAYAGLGYKVSIPGDNINGVAAFKKN